MKTRETISISLPKNSKEILKSMAYERNITTSKLIELLIRGKEEIPKIEWDQWELYYNQKEE